MSQTVLRRAVSLEKFRVSCCAASANHSVGSVTTWQTNTKKLKQTKGPKAALKGFGLVWKFVLSDILVYSDNSVRDAMLCAAFLPPKIFSARVELYCSKIQGQLLSSHLLITR